MGFDVSIRAEMEPDDAKVALQTEKRLFALGFSNPHKVKQAKRSVDQAQKALARARRNPMNASWRDSQGGKGD